MLTFANLRIAFVSSSSSEAAPLSEARVCNQVVLKRVTYPLWRVLYRPPQPCLMALLRTTLIKSSSVVTRQREGGHYNCAGRLAPISATWRAAAAGIQTNVKFKQEGRVRLVPLNPCSHAEIELTNFRHGDKQLPKQDLFLHLALLCSFAS